MPEHHQFREVLRQMPDRDFAGLVLATPTEKGPIATEARRRCQRKGLPFSVDQYFSLAALTPEAIRRLMGLRDAAMAAAKFDAQCWPDEVEIYGRELFREKNYFGGWWEDGALEEELGRRQ